MYMYVHVHVHTCDHTLYTFKLGFFLGTNEL